MADAAVSRRASFEWHIHNPFLPSRRYEATFSHGSPAIKLWKVTFESIDRRINNWVYSVSLEFLERFEPRFEFVADKVKVSIGLNGEKVTEQEFKRFLFCIANRFKCYINGSGQISPQMDPHHLVISIEISLPKSGAENKVDLYYKDSSLRMLSTDLKCLLRDEKYCDMTLWSANPRRGFPAHSFIIDARWSNFFKKHPLNGNNWQNVETNISSSLLLDILAFMYSGTWGVNWPYWENAAYAKELFQVMDWYRMNHLYNVFMKNDLQHVRVIRNPVLIETLLLPLGIVDGRPVGKASYMWDVIYKPQCEIFFQIRVGNQAGNWLSYSLQSKSPSRVYAEVSFQLVKMVEGEELAARSFHVQDFALDPEASVERECVLFLSCLETFGDFASPAPDGREAEFFMRCFLTLTDGKTIEQVTSVCGDASQLASEMFAVLSRDMRRVQKRKWHSDMQILSLPGFVDELVLAERIHRGILAARVPRWWEALVNARQENGIPEAAVSTLSIETLPTVLEYIYTGRSNVISNISLPFVDEVEQFAQKTLFKALLDIVARIPSREFYKTV